MGKQSSTHPRPQRSNARDRTPLCPDLGLKFARSGLLRLAFPFFFSLLSPAQTATTSVPLVLPTTIVFDPSGNLYVAETNRHVIDRIDASGAVTVIAGNGIQGFSGDSGPATSAQLDSPQGLAVDPAGNLYIADTHNHRVRMVIASSGIITTIAGNGVAGFSSDQAQAVTARLNLPTALALDGADNLDIADSNNHRIRQLNLSSGILSTIAGNGIQADAGDGGAALNASVDTPTGMAVDSSHNLYLADTHNHRIRRIDHASGIITAIAGGNTSANGPKILLPRGMSIDSAGNVYVADMQAHRILRVALNGTLSTVAGAGTQGFAGDNGLAVAALLDSPRSSAVSPAGLLTIADTGNQRVRQLDTSAVIHTLSGVGIPLQVALTLTSPTSVQYGTGTVTASLSTPATGSINFFERSGSLLTPLGSGSLAGNAASYSTGQLPAGLHQLVAIYSGDGTHLPVQSTIYPLTITPAPISATPTGATVVYGQSIPSLTGVITGILPQDASLVSAVFSTTAGPLSPAASYPIEVTLSGASAVNYQLAALSSAFLIISQAPTATTLSASASSLSQGSTVTFSARAASTTLGLPTGRITFFDNASSMGSSSLDQSGAATLSASLNPGAHSVTAVYSGDANFLSSSSSSVSAVVSTSSGAPEDFTLSPTGSASQTTSSGASVTFPFAVTVVNGTLNSPILLAVTGMPVGATASFSPNAIPPGLAASSFTLTVQTAKTVARRTLPADSMWPMIFCAMLAIAPIGFPRKPHGVGRPNLLRHLPIVLGVISVGCIAGCGTSIANLPQPAAKSTTYPLTVTATSTSSSGTPLQHTANISLTLQ